MPESTSDSVQDFRLDRIEKNLDELSQKLDALNDINIKMRDIESRLDILQELRDAINSHEKRLRKLELAPMEQSSGRWNYIMDYAFKSIVAAGVGFILVKVGLK